MSLEREGGRLARGYGLAGAAAPEQWSLKRIHEVSGTDGSPIQHEHGFRLDPEKRSVEELEIIERGMLRQLAEQAGGGE